MKQTFLEQQLKLKRIKETFTSALREHLNLTEVDGPLLVAERDGEQDQLSGTEQPVKVPVPAMSEQLEFVHSLAKWKRKFLADYQFAQDEGIVVHMKALRPDERLDSPIHSIYVDQWDWEKVILPGQRSAEVLKQHASSVYAALIDTIESASDFGVVAPSVPESLTFISSEELLARYPSLTPKAREHQAAKDFGAVFVQGIGAQLSDGKVHDVRAPDYDDWTLNGDLIVWNPVLGESLELSSMGIRVDEKSLKEQLEKAEKLHYLEYPWHQRLLEQQMPATVGGGIGQSRVCMWMLQEPHIGRVQRSVWPAEIKQSLQLW